MENWKYKLILFYIVCAFIIGYPFFTIAYFETLTALKIVAKYLIIPIFICLSIVGPKFYYKKIKPHEKRTPKPKSKLKEKAGDILSIIMMIFCATLLFLGITFSLIITTNKFIGKSEIVKIKVPVENYQPYITKHGRLRHYIYFKDPKTKEKIKLEVYRKYHYGEIFEKEMKYGSWGILYATEK